jgi:hypothetical protein
MSDFPDFDQAYKTVLVKDLEDKFEQLATKANFNIYHSDIWRGTARKFAESIVCECLYNMQNCDGDLDFAIWKTKKDFGIEE